MLSATRGISLRIFFNGFNINDLHLWVVVSSFAYALFGPILIYVLRRFNKATVTTSKGVLNDFLEDVVIMGLAFLIINASFMFSFSVWS